jgi:hypothetical protein
MSSHTGLVPEGRDESSPVLWCWVLIDDSVSVLVGRSNRVSPWAV